MACVILGLEYFHRQNIVYEYLKPENFLVFSDGFVKLRDFMSSRELKDGIKEFEGLGTRLYYAPEKVYE